LNKECNDEPITSEAEARGLEEGEKGKSNRREKRPNETSSVITEGNSYMVWAMSCKSSIQARQDSSMNEHTIRNTDERSNHVHCNYGGDKHQ